LSAYRIGPVSPGRGSGQVLERDPIVRAADKLDCFLLRQRTTAIGKGTRQTTAAHILVVIDRGRELRRNHIAVAVVDRSRAASIKRSGLIFPTVNAHRPGIET